MVRPLFVPVIVVIVGADGIVGTTTISVEGDIGNGGIFTIPPTLIVSPPPTSPRKYSV
jgi:hypothetical protein